MVHPRKSNLCVCLVIAILVLVTGILLYKSIYVNQTSIPTPLPTVSTSNWDKFIHKLDNTVTLSFNYPKNSTIEEKKLNSTYYIKILPKPGFYLDTKTVEIYVDRIPKGQEANYDQTKLALKDKQSMQGNLVSGVLPYKINNFSTFEVYSDACLEAREAQVDCRKTSIYNLNYLGYHLRVVSTHFTDENSEPFRNETIDKIISSIAVSSNN